MSRNVIAILLSLNVFSCKTPEVTTPSSTGKADYWPLEVRNSWTYSYQLDTRFPSGSEKFIGNLQMEVVSNSASDSGTIHSIRLTFNGLAIIGNVSPVIIDTVAVKDSVISYRYYEDKESALVPLLDYPGDVFWVSLLHSGLNSFGIHRFYEASSPDTLKLFWTNGTSVRSARFLKHNGLVLWESVAGNNTYWILKMYLLTSQLVSGSVDPR